MKGVWIWPENDKEQANVLKKIKESNYLIKMLVAISKSKDGLSNAQVDTLLTNNSQWRTFWVLRQLESLGFIQYRVDIFGGPGKYAATQLGKTTIQRLTGQTEQKKT